RRRDFDGYPPRARRAGRGATTENIRRYLRKEQRSHARREPAQTLQNLCDGVLVGAVRTAGFGLSWPDGGCAVDDHAGAGRRRARRGGAVGGGGAAARNL